MSIGIACLLADDPDRAAALAAQLTRLNDERREIEQRMQIEAIELAAAVRFDDAGGEALGVCLFDEGWHQGVVGLVAGRVKDRLHRPVIAFARADAGTLRGSARSVAGIHIRDVLDGIATRHPGLIEKFGGHAMAAGMSLPEANLEPFRAAFAAEVAARAGGDVLRGVIHSDGALCPDEMCLATARALKAAGPWGQGFPEPVFDGDFIVADVRVVGARHLKLSLREAAGGATAGGGRAGGAFSSASGARCFDAIAFGYADAAVHPATLVRPGAAIGLAYRLEINEYNGTESVQLNCQHLYVR
jgi:single-stranded-DNA-specific exonuclease